jgi:hypothetical protein
MCVCNIHTNASKQAFCCICVPLSNDNFNLDAPCMRTCAIVVVGFARTCALTIANICS